MQFKEYKMGEFLKKPKQNFKDLYYIIQGQCKICYEKQFAIKFKEYKDKKKSGIYKEYILKEIINKNKRVNKSYYYNLFYNNTRGFNNDLKRVDND